MDTDNTNTGKDTDTGNTGKDIDNTDTDTNRHHHRRELVQSVRDIVDV